jgi:hypothetical protein
MQTLLKAPILVLLSGLLWSARAAEQTAVVNEGKINVRGQPALIGEVVTQLQKGESVTVLDYVKNERAKPGEPTNWAKIKLPANTPVWVYSEMIRDGAVSATRLNLRAGPGDNYSVIGRLNRGDQVKTIRTMGDWTEIEAPAGAYAFVDASLIKAAGESAVAAVPRTTPEPEAQPPTETTPTAPPVSTPAPAIPTQDALIAATQPPTTNQPPATQPSPTTTRPIFTNEAALVTAPTTAVTPGTSTLSQPTFVPPTVTTQPGRTTQPSVASQSEAPSARRIVRREGIVRSTISVQAPTWYELVHPETKKTIDYLHGEKMGLKLKPFKGQKVIVSGEELIDPRWPNTPILEIETLDFAP